MLGVKLNLEEEQLKVEEVTEDSGAEKAGLQAGDILLSLEGEAIQELEELVEALEERQVGEMAKVTIEREGEEMDLEVELSGRADLFGEKATRNDAMSGEFSRRRSGFPRVMQTDIMGDFKRMGGPVLNLEGDCVGMNIARVSRCETYAVPARELEKLFASLLDSASE